jgi:hypothetical protein
MDDEQPTTRGERRDKKKTRRKYPVHGGSLRAVYPSSVLKKLKKPPK